jgi:hypothetical protein
VPLGDDQAGLGLDRPLHLERGASNILARVAPARLTAKWWRSTYRRSKKRSVRRQAE